MKLLQLICPMICRIYCCILVGQFYDAKNQRSHHWRR